jgi:hypothetical protein
VLRTIFNDIPSNSPLRQSFIRYFQSTPLTQGQVGTLLGIDRTSVGRAFNDDTNPTLRYYFRDLGFRRNRLGMKRPCLVNWFTRHCGVPSGRLKRYFESKGTALSMYLSYVVDCREKELPYVGYTTFHFERKRERIGILKGDIFSNPLVLEKAKRTKELNAIEEEAASVRASISEIEKQIEAENKKRHPKTAKLQGELEAKQLEIEDMTTEKQDLNDRLDAIDSELEEGKKRKEEYRKAHVELMLPKNKKKAIITFDFFSTGKLSQSDSKSEFSSSVMVIATPSKLVVPPALVQQQIQPIAPDSLLSPEVAELMLNRPTKEKVHVKRNESKINPKQSHVKYQASLDKATFMPPLEIRETADSPHYTYFHGLSNTTNDEDERVAQTHDYAVFALHYLLVKHKLLKDYDTVEIWSDGCSKHFKCYATHFYVAILKSLAALNLSWDFLPPNDAHNRADGAAAKLAVRIKQCVESTFLITEVGHIAAISGHLQNCYKFECAKELFPPRIDATPKPTTDSFIQDAWTIKYHPPRKEKRCGEKHGHCKSMWQFEMFRRFV